LNVQQLADAVGALDARDALQCKLSVDEWRQLAPYLSVTFLRTGEPLMQEGESDRTVYILAEGDLEVTTQGHSIATLKPGTVAGEGTFFSGMPRSATVIPSTPGVAWGLHWDKFEKMSHRHPRLACDLMKGLATVLAVRMREAVLVGNFS
jgi:CRP/FNR family transcriptional regulator, cyclic AMP receptor protein